MKYKIHFPYFNREDMLREAVDSVRSLGHIHIWSDGVPPPAIEGVEHHALPPNGAAATINAALQSSWDDDDVAFLMHADALALPGAPERLRDFTQARLDSGERWGVIFTLYDVFCAFNMTAVREVGYWDVRLYQYGSDNDYWRRLKLANYSIIESAPIPGIADTPDKFFGKAHINESVGVIHRGSASIRSDPLFKYISDGRNPGNEAYYILKWGGLPNHETFTRPFEGFYTQGTGA